MPGGLYPSGSRFFSSPASYAGNVVMCRSGGDKPAAASTLPFNAYFVSGCAEIQIQFSALTN